jgi:hypothetical protein
MVKTKKLNEACFLACVAGFLEDNGSNKTQADILSELQAMSLCDDRGIVNRNTEAAACNQLGVNLQESLYRYPIDAELDDGSWLITTNGSQMHCLRFKKRISDELFEVMNPDTGNFETWERSYIESQVPKLFQMKMQ